MCNGGGSPVYCSFKVPGVAVTSHQNTKKGRLQNGRIMPMVVIGCLSLRAEFWMHPYGMVSNAAPSSNSNQPIKQLVLRMLLFLLLLLLLVLG
jgi:hypothetical protein